MGCSSCGCRRSHKNACGCRKNNCDCNKTTNCLLDQGATVGVTNIDLHDANQSLTLGQLGNGAIRVGSTPALTGSRTVTLPTGTYSLVVAGDSTLGTFPVVFTTGSGTTVSVGAGQQALVNVSAAGVASAF
jgi:hypothetical protein